MRTLWDTFKRETLEAAKKCIGERPRSRCGFTSVETLESIEESHGARLAGSFSISAACSGVNLIESHFARSTMCGGSAGLASSVPPSISLPQLLAAAWRLRAVSLVPATPPSLTTRQCSSRLSSSTYELVSGLSNCSTAPSRTSGTVSPRTYCTSAFFRGLYTLHSEPGNPASTDRVPPGQP